MGRTGLGGGRSGASPPGIGSPVGGTGLGSPVWTGSWLSTGRGFNEPGIPTERLGFDVGATTPSVDTALAPAGWLLGTVSPTVAAAVALPVGAGGSCPGAVADVTPAAGVKN